MEDQRVRTNFWLLSRIKIIDVFFYSIFKIILSKNNFIGCFVDNIQ